MKTIWEAFSYKHVAKIIPENTVRNLLHYCIRKSQLGLALSNTNVLKDCSHLSISNTEFNIRVLFTAYDLVCQFLQGGSFSLKLIES